MFVQGFDMRQQKGIYGCRVAQMRETRVFGFVGAT